MIGHCFRSLRLMFGFTVMALLAEARLAPAQPAPRHYADGTWIPATDTAWVVRTGAWSEAAFRYAERQHLYSAQEGATLECGFAGTGVMLALEDHDVPAYGSPNLGRLEVQVDGGVVQTMHPRDLPTRITIARDLPAGAHRVRVTHRVAGDGAGCRIQGFLILRAPTGDLSFTVTGEALAYLVDVRAILRRGEREVRNELVRNWMTGQCRLAGLPPGEGYSLEVSAMGWTPALVESSRGRI